MQQEDLLGFCLENGMNFSLKGTEGQHDNDCESEEILDEASQEQRVVGGALEELI